MKPGALFYSCPGHIDSSNPGNEGLKEVRWTWICASCVPSFPAPGYCHQLKIVFKIVTVIVKI